MKPEQFIREYGVDKAREVVEGIPSKYMECYYSTLCYCTKAKKYSDRFNPRIELVNMADLKRLVESIDLVEKLGGLSKAKDTLLQASDGVIDCTSLIRAIRDHESIYGGGGES
ncbi:hypothetical protein BRC2024_OQYPJBKP_CDS_0042 [Acinetobacter phage vB_AbaM_Highwayman]